MHGVQDRTDAATFYLPPAARARSARNRVWSAAAMTMPRPRLGISADDYVRSKSDDPRAPNVDSASQLALKSEVLAPARRAWHTCRA